MNGNVKCCAARCCAARPEADSDFRQLLLAGNMPPLPEGKIFEMWVIPKSGAPSIIMALR